MSKDKEQIGPLETMLANHFKEQEFATTYLSRRLGTLAGQSFVDENDNDLETLKGSQITDYFVNLASWIFKYRCKYLEIDQDEETWALIEAYIREPDSLGSKENQALEAVKSLENLTGFELRKHMASALLNDELGAVTAGKYTKLVTEGRLEVLGKDQEIEVTMKVRDNNLETCANDITKLGQPFGRTYADGDLDSVRKVASQFFELANMYEKNPTIRENYFK